MQFAGLSDASEVFDLSINGVDVNLNDMIANGEASIVPVSEYPLNNTGYDADQDIVVDENGDVVADGPVGADGLEEVMFVSFNVEITTLSASFSSTITNGSAAVDLFSNPNAIVPCFTPGTFIKTDKGSVDIEDLSVGDLVETLNNGLQPIRWIGRRRVEARGRFAPVTIEVGAIGNSQRLIVSPCLSGFITIAKNVPM